MTPADLETVHAFMHAHVPSDSRQTAEWLAWQYVDNPEGFDVRLALVDDRIVGMSGFLPCRVEVDGEVRTAAFSTNTLVDPAHRGRGIGREIHEARLADYEWALSSGQSPANRRLYDRMGFTLAGRYRRVFAQPHLPAATANVRYLRELGAWVYGRARGGAGTGALSVAVGSEVPDAPEACYRERFRRPAIGPVWDVAHVRWRYERHPYFTYEFVVVTDTVRTRGFAVLRRTAATRVLVDLYARHDDQVSVLRAVADHVGAITGQVVGATLDRTFRKAGWLTLPASNRLVGRSNDPVLDGLLRERLWCFFGGDSDSDR